MRLLTIFILLLVFISCESPVEVVDAHNIKENILSPGTWNVDCHINDSISIPFRLEIDSGLALTIVNHKERIKITDLLIEEDSIRFKMPRFDSEFIGTIETQNSFSGQWFNYLKTDYSIPFEANFIQEELLVQSNGSHSSKYSVTFSPDTDDEYKAIGLFHKGTSYSYGTFITETGDYRFLEGILTDSRIKLSCFDGSHLFLFTADIEEDQILNGQFYSGKHWFEPWKGHRHEEVELRDPDSLTYLNEGYETVEFTVKNLQHEDRSFTKEDYKNKVTIIQIFGSWCPNCYDENEFYKELFESHKEDDFQIIAIAFEPGDTFEKQVSYVKKQFEEIKMPYEPFIGGKVGKSIASEKFPMLNKIMSYPTSIFIDKEGKVRKIHTGFYGPGTGKYYTEYVMSTKLFVEELLEE